jgi:hypothetical protein
MAMAFIPAMFSLKTGCQVSLNPGVQVAAPNGKVMPSDIILGADWIYIHSPVGLNFQRLRNLSSIKSDNLI